MVKSKSNMRITLLFLSLLLPVTTVHAEEPLTYRQCIEYAVQHNLNLQKDRLAVESAVQSKREVVGALLPQLSASAGFTDNIQKTKITMPNFVNDMLPEPMRDPNASKYMSVTMGTDLSANWGLSVAQQVFNYSLISAVGIAKVAGEMAEAGVEITTNDVVAQTATLYFNSQVLEYAISQFDKSITLMENSEKMMTVFHENGVIRKVDLDQIIVAKTNMETQKMDLELALEVQKKLLKLQMGYEMNDPIEIEPFDADRMEEFIYSHSLSNFDVYEQLPYKMVKYQQDMLGYQKKSAIGEVLPTLVLTGSYSHNYLGDDFKGPTYQHFPVSMVMLNLKVPIFTGLSKTAKIRKAEIEIRKAQRDEQLLIQSLTMGYGNARSQFDQNMRTVEAQHRNKDLAMEVMDVTQKNYEEGLSSLSDLLNANSSFIQAQMNYTNALNKCIEAFINLKKTDGTIQEIIK